MVYMISYNFNKSTESNSDLKSKIKEVSESTDWVDDLESSLIIKSNLTCKQIYEKVKPIIDDNFIVIEVTKNYFGWLPNDVWRFLKDMFN